MKKGTFACGEAALDEYLRRQARQDMERGFSTVIAATDAATPETVVGFYTLNASSILLPDIPEDLQKKIPRYPAVPAILLGRLAVSAEFQGRHIGTLLVVDALARACRNELAWAIFCVEAKSKKVAAFYAKMMFRPFQERPQSLWMHRKQAEAIAGALGRMLCLSEISILRKFDTAPDAGAFRG
jgi:GNAT superfamily N-acetyltransferase